MSSHNPSVPLFGSRRIGSRALALTLVPALVLGWLTIGTAPPATAATVTGEAKAVGDGPFSAQELGTVQINGVVWDQEIIGNTVYVAGDFSSARPAGAAPGQQETPRANLLAYDITTGKLVEGWAPRVNAQVKTITASPDGGSLYIGGSFTELNGEVVSRIAKVSARDGARDTRFRSHPVATVNSIAVGPDNTVYYGGVFGQVGLTLRKRVAAVDADTGAIKPLAPDVEGGAVWTVAVDSKGSLFIGGAFTSVNGSSNPGYGMAKLDGVNGALQPWAVNSLVRNGGVKGAITSLTIRDDVVYGTGYMKSRTGNNLEGAFAANAADGSVVWVNDCHGDSYDTVPTGDTLYAVNHAHDCSTLGEWDDVAPYYRFGTAMTKDATSQLVADNNFFYNYAGTPAPTLRSWEPTYRAGSYTTSNQASWTGETNGDYLVFGGEFLSVNGRPQQGLVRFPAKRLSDKYPPYLRGDSLELTATPRPRGGVDLTWKGSWDRDSRNLTYHLIRNGDVQNPVDVQAANSTSWNVPSFSFRDTSAEGPVTYQVIVKDPQGNSVRSNEVSAVASGGEGTGGSLYAREIVKDSPQDFWRMGDSRNSWFGSNEVRDNALRHNSAVSPGVWGALVGDTDSATRYSLPGWFSQSGSGSSQRQTASDEFSTELWFNTNSTRGGQLIGFGNRQSGLSSESDRVLMMERDGSLVAAAYSGGIRKLVSPGRYNDGRWHHAVVSLSGNGYSLYVDGQRVAHDPGVTRSGQFNGYWRVGGDVVSIWNMRTNNPWFEGSLDEVAVYSRALDAEAVSRHYSAGAAPGRAAKGGEAPAAPGANAADADPGKAVEDPATPGVKAPDPAEVPRQDGNERK